MYKQFIKSNFKKTKGGMIMKKESRNGEYKIITLAKNTGVFIMLLVFVVVICAHCRQKTLYRDDRQFIYFIGEEFTAKYLQSNHLLNKINRQHKINCSLLIVGDINAELLEVAQLAFNEIYDGGEDVNALMVAYSKENLQIEIISGEKVGKMYDLKDVESLKMFGNNDEELVEIVAEIVAQLQAIVSEVT